MDKFKEIEDRRDKKVTNLYRRAGFLQKFFFVWMLPLFYKVHKHGLTEDDIFPSLKAHDSEILATKLENEWNKELKANKPKPSLWRAFARVFGLEMILYGFGYFSYEIVRLGQPLALAKLLEYFQPGSKMTINEAYMYAGIIACITLVLTFINHHSLLHVFHLGMRVKGATSALIYRKAIRLSKSALADTTIGQMVNLISNDVSRFETGVYNFNDIFIAPFNLTILLFLLYWYAGWISLAGVTLFFALVPFQLWMAKKTSTYRFKIAKRTDERIRVMNEIITGMQVIKMYAWEKPLAKLVDLMRRLEMKEIRKTSTLKAIDTSFHMFLTKTVIYFCVVAYVLAGNTLNAQYVFGFTMFYEYVRQCLFFAFTEGMRQLAEAITSARRITEFLMYEEVDPQGTLNGAAELPLDGTRVSLEDVSTKWKKSSADNTLTNVNFNLSKGELATIIGKVGSGKSTLLHVILKELPPLTGAVRVSGTVSYASQEPWLFVGSVRENILFGEELDLIKYHEVVKVCALETDLKLLPYGDRTIIGERGVSLSGGQKARINLARAIYKEADIYLLDDPLSAVDAQVGKRIFNKCIEGYLKEKSVVLVTHQLQYLKECKKIYLIKDGKVENSGTFEQIKQAEGEFTKLLEELKKEEEEAKEAEEVRKRKRTMSAKEEEEGDERNQKDPTIEKESKSEGKVTWKVYKSYFLAGGSAFKIFMLMFIYIFSQIVAGGVDYFLSVWVNMEEMKLANNITEFNGTFIEDLDSSEYSIVQKFWFSVLTRNTCLLIYTGLVVSMVPLIMGRTIWFFHQCIKSSINLHNNMFSKIVYAPMRFFNINPSGRILNRFSKDMNAVDEELPKTFSDTLQIGLLMASNIAIVAIVVPVTLVPAVVALVIFYLMKVVYIPTSRDTKRLEGITRSPVYSHLTASLQGLTTIRAFGAQKMVIKTFDRYHSTYNSVSFMFIAANRTFGYWLDLNTAVFTCVVIFSFLVLKIDTLGGSAGLAITQAINLAGWFQYGIRQWTQTENNMTSAERIKEYADVAPESEAHAKPAPESWPQKGSIRFANVCLRYSQDEPSVLKDLNLQIKHKEKVEIVGRTGAGKSSMIAALFRLAEIDGHIFIDDIDTKTIPLHQLRSSISIIPQEPVLFSGTLRKNLDPFDEFSDGVLWDALEEVELKGAVTDLPHGLESRISEGGSNFSVGQRQLVCLARAIIRNNKILVLDEATASVDSHTDGLIQTTIRKKFADCTVLTIAHRLHTVMDSDRVLVMDAGRVVEFDHPHLLLQNKQGKLHSLLQETGKAMAETLSAIALEAYQAQNV